MTICVFFLASRCFLRIRVGSFGENFLTFLIAIFFFYSELRSFNLTKKSPKCIFVFFLEHLDASSYRSQTEIQKLFLRLNDLNWTPSQKEQITGKSRMDDWRRGSGPGWHQRPLHSSDYWPGYPGGHRQGQDRDICQNQWIPTSLEPPSSYWGPMVLARWWNPQLCTLQNLIPSLLETGYDIKVERSPNNAPRRKPRHTTKQWSGISLMRRCAIKMMTWSSYRGGRP